ncbi:hypothetical protein [Candidatus Hepatoplasma crinochetorum]|jgi:hypothetical protein|uniref:Uncharacterized protein n=1 Tax=Candidatus Hepatoplasma crinochetorum Av TaxID=1427984 RepID=W8GFQ7_9MOLU|nr:hypothetical protein [Candidatus Hepatoplasma crinochetorum]AHK22619.1 hypothetical protein X271_00519 [Candidatus Hepatoplasma crinochetorum Av]BDV03201.1 MAG: hypothetical protein HCTKY_4950 [Candidatus Hepatoplasma crinochetorum]
MDDFKNKLKSGTGWKIVATIMAFVWLLNLFIVWFSTESFEWMKKNMAIRIIVSVVFVIFWIPAIIVGIYWIWFV